MRKGQTLTATERAERARANTRRAMARDVLTARILARVWTSYRVDGSGLNPEYPWLVCVASPAGLLVWRIPADELPLFEALPVRKRTNELPLDRLPTLQALAEQGWN